MEVIPIGGRSSIPQEVEIESDGWPLVMSPKTLAELLEVAPSTLSMWRDTWRGGKQGDGPAFFHIGRLVRYRGEVVREWIASLEEVE